MNIPPTKNVNVSDATKPWHTASFLDAGSQRAHAQQQRLVTTPVKIASTISATANNTAGHTMTSCTYGFAAVRPVPPTASCDKSRRGPMECAASVASDGE